MESATPGVARLVLQDVRKVIKGVVVVERLNLTVEEGEFLVILGPSGCGKSTTLNMIAGLEAVTEGEIYICERNVTHLPPKDRRIAMVFQNYALYPHMTVAENMGFGLRMAKTPRTEIARKVASAAQILGIEELLERKPAQLSGGQRQRVAVGRAIVRNPDLFLFDEPLSNLDAKLRGHMRVELKQLHDRLGATTVYVTHDQTEAMTMASRIVVMRAGLIQQIGAPLEIYNRPRNRFVGEFVGSPTMNFISCRLIREPSGLYATGAALRVPLPAHWLPGIDPERSGNVVLGIRPEDIHVYGVGPGLPAADYLRAEIAAVEPLGNETYLVLRIGPHLLTAAVSALQPARVHETVQIALDPNKVHVFSSDPRGEALSHGD